jgi:hypothetical protein
MVPTGGQKQVLLRGGVHMEGRTVLIVAADSGLTIANYNDESATVSGAVVSDRH